MLYNKDDQSRFLSVAQYYNDSIDTEFVREHPDPRSMKKVTPKYVQLWSNLFEDHYQNNHKKARSAYYINKSHSTGEIINFAMHTYPKHYLKGKVNLQWEITDERKIIQSEECIKAKTTYGGRNYIAWFVISAFAVVVRGPNSIRAPKNTGNTFFEIIEITPVG